jgi:hypothetical protein
MNAWHYTIWHQRAECILREGYIRPSNDAGKARKNLITWFSARQTYEPTARKRFFSSDDYRLRVATTEEAVEFFGGLYRFGLPLDATLSWLECCAAAGFTFTERRKLESLGIKQGGTPYDWRGVVGDVPLAKSVAVERWQDGAFVPTAKTMM